MNELNLFFARIFTTFQDQVHCFSMQVVVN